ncbi:hypothetical protein V5S56_03035 [Corynebacterium propinquum]|nr:hypothetical protein [Corynebacterium propinquum]MDK4238274.1 hypothetical protein [Corynebacterium propinquum]
MALVHHDPNEFRIQACTHLLGDVRCVSGAVNGGAAGADVDSGEGLPGCVDVETDPERVAACRLCGQKTEVIWAVNHDGNRAT